MPLPINATPTTPTLSTEHKIVDTYAGYSSTGVCGSQKPEDVANLVMDFFDAVNEGNRAKIAQFFGKNFAWYSMTEGDVQSQKVIRHVAYIADQPNAPAEKGEGMHSGEREKMIEQLLDYFMERHKQHEQLHLLELLHLGGGTVNFRVRRYADDLDPALWAPDYLAVGKGGVDCEQRKIEAWGMAMNAHLSPAEAKDFFVICPTPVSGKPPDTTIACAHKSPQ